MNPNSISIRIEKPCHEDWDKMTPTETGKFCAACKKNVTDLSSMTDNEVLAFLENHTGKMCGQLRGSQLNRMIVHTKLQGKNYRLNTFFAALVLAGGAGSAAAQTTTDQTPVYHPTVVIDEKHPTGPVCIRTTPEKKEKLTLHALVMDSVLHERVVNATVSVKGTNISTETDEHGRFTLDIPDSLAGDSITLMIYNPGYYWEWVTIAKADINSTTKLEVAFEERMMKGEMIIEE